MLSIFALNALIRLAANCCLLLALWGSIAAPSRAGSTEQDLTIFAAASLSKVLPELNATWQQEQNGQRAQISFAASAILARQIEAGAPATVFLSANRVWVDYLSNHSPEFVRPIRIAHNALVLASPCRDPQGTITENQLEDYLATNRFAMADPALAPAGAYAQSFLEKQKIWNNVRTNAAYAGNARLALLLIERANMPGIVYATDAHASNAVCTRLELPLPVEQGVTYFAVSRDWNKIGATFIDWLLSPMAKAIWAKHGFKPVSN